MVTAILNAKGGAGKSTTALHLAGALHELGPTALVDLDDGNRTCVDYAAAGHLPYTVADVATWDAGTNRGPWAHVVADAYARPSADQLAYLAQLADVLVLPTPPDATSLRVLARFLPTIAALGTPYTVMLTQVPPWPSRAAERARRDLKAGRVPVLEAQVPRAAAYTNGSRARRLAWDMPGGKAQLQVFEGVAREVLTYG